MTKQYKWNADFNIVIAHRGPWMGLWMTINSCEMALWRNGRPKYDYAYTIVLNGMKHKDVPVDFWHQIGYLKMDKAVKVIIHPEPLSPPSARQLGTCLGDGDFIFFFDNHVMVQPDYFDRAIEQMTEKNIDMLHSAFRFHSRTITDHHYSLLLKQNFWAKSEPFPHNPNEPYMCAASGHGGFVVRRSVWQKLGGYWNGFRGYAGEELYWDLKMWLTGHSVWLDPKLIHYHFAGERGYPRHLSDDFYMNLLMCANVIGGMKYVDTIYRNFRKSTRMTKTQRSMFSLYTEAVERSTSHAAQLQSTFIRTLDEQLEWFRANGVPFE